MSDHYVYIHKRASDSTVFYIGKGCRRRAWATSGRNQVWKNIVAKHGVVVYIAHSGLSENCAFTLERILVAANRIACIANLVDGGGGTCGMRHTEESRARIGAANKGKIMTLKALTNLQACRTGRKIKEATRLKMSAAKLGRKHDWHTEASRAAISSAHMGMRPSDASRAKMSASKIGKAIGILSPTYDHTIRTFVHPEHGRFRGTRADFITRYALGASCVSELVNGKRKTVKNWKVST